VIWMPINWLMSLIVADCASLSVMGYSKLLQIIKPNNQINTIEYYILKFEKYSEKSPKQSSTLFPPPFTDCSQ
jgi:hypothetical protein